MTTEGANPEGAQKDPVLDFLQKFTLGSMRLKPDKWHRLLISDEMRNYITNFVDRPLPQVSFNNLKQIREWKVWLYRLINPLPYASKYLYCAFYLMKWNK